MGFLAPWRPLALVALGTISGACEKSTRGESTMRLATVATMPPPVAVLVEAPPPAPAVVPWASALTPITVRNVNTRAEATIRLYRPDGTIDPDGMAAFEDVAGDGAHPVKLTGRVVQLVFKAAYHFKADAITLISTVRPKKRGRASHHTTGEAIDFQIPSVDYRKLASHLRSYPRAGVGVYTNPNTHFVHVDVRDQSYHWLDASPPGIAWREARMYDPNAEARDESYTSESDLPIQPEK